MLKAATIGADPEVFAVDERTGEVQPLCGLLGGKKGKPVPLGDLPAGYGLQEDNVMAEFNVPPAGSVGAFTEHITRAVETLKHVLREKDPHLDVDNRCSRLFRAQHIDRHKQAMHFGCSADYDAYQSGRTVAPLHSLDLMDDDGHWRFAGGHIHLGYVAKPDRDPEKRPSFPVPDYVAAQFCDVFLGLPSLREDRQGERRRHYGTAGRFRPTPYGIEYRTLSNFWVFDNNLTHQLGTNALALGNLLRTNHERLRSLYLEVPWGAVKAAIDKEDEGEADKLLAFVEQDLGLNLRPLMTF